MDLGIYPDQLASVTLLGQHVAKPGVPVRVVSVSAREIIVAATRGVLTPGVAVKLACTPYIVLGRVGSVQPYPGEDQVRLEVRHLLSEADLHVIHEKWF